MASGDGGDGDGGEDTRKLFAEDAIIALEQTRCAQEYKLTFSISISFKFYLNFYRNTLLCGIESFDLIAFAH